MTVSLITLGICIGLVIVCVIVVKIVRKFKWPG